jgi:hypothetical protein
VLVRASPNSSEFFQICPIFFKLIVQLYHVLEGWSYVHFLVIRTFEELIFSVDVQIHWQYYSRLTFRHLFQLRTDQTGHFFIKYGNVVVETWENNRNNIQWQLKQLKLFF